MIITIILNIMWGVLNVILAPLSLLPDVVVNSTFATSLATASTYLSALADVFPIATLLQVFVFWLLIHNYMFIFNGIKWLIKKIPTIS